jgi:uncharacterized protein with FMN-binding domain
VAPNSNLSGDSRLPGSPPVAPPATAPVTAQAPSTPAPRAAASRRQHPAQGARAVALVSSILSTLGVGVALARADSPAATTTTPSAAGSTAPTTPGAGGSVPTGGAAGSAASSTAPAAGTTSPAGSYADGVYTGPAEYTRWGDVQVQVTIRNGKITSVEEVQAPSDGRSVRINSRAQPILESEAVAAQNANIDAVSGATYTSETYTASLQAALDQASSTTR